MFATSAYSTHAVDLPQRVVTPEGLEKTMATNHYGPFLLTYLLMGTVTLLATVLPCQTVCVNRPPAAC